MTDLENYLSEPSRDDRIRQDHDTAASADGAVDQLRGAGPPYGSVYLGVRLCADKQTGTGPTVDLQVHPVSGDEATAVTGENCSTVTPISAGTEDLQGRHRPAGCKA